MKNPATTLTTLCAISIATGALATNPAVKLVDDFGAAAGQSRALGQGSARGAGDDIANKVSKEGTSMSAQDSLPVPQSGMTGTSLNQANATKIRRLQPVPDHQMKLVIDHQHMSAIRAVAKIPEDWVPKPVGNKDMTLPGQAKPYRNPNLERGVELQHPHNAQTFIRVMPGNPSSPYRQSAYVKAHGPGGFRDKNGQILNREQWENANKRDEYLRRIHIPLHEFEFGKMGFE